MSTCKYIYSLTDPICHNATTHASLYDCATEMHAFSGIRKFSVESEAAKVMLKDLEMRCRNDPTCGVYPAYYKTPGVCCMSTCLNNMCLCMCTCAILRSAFLTHMQTHTNTEEGAKAMFNELKLLIAPRLELAKFEKNAKYDWF